MLPLPPGARRKVQCDAGDIPSGSGGSAMKPPAGVAAWRRALSKNAAQSDSRGAAVEPLRLWLRKAWAARLPRNRRGRFGVFRGRCRECLGTARCGCRLDEEVHAQLCAEGIFAAFCSPTWMFALAPHLACLVRTSAKLSASRRATGLGHGPAGACLCTGGVIRLPI